MLTAIYPYARIVGGWICRLNDYLHAWRELLDDACPCGNHRGDDDR